MDTVGEIAEVWNGLEEVSLDQRDVVELRSASGAGLCALRVQKHLKHTKREKGQEKLVFFLNGKPASQLRNKDMVPKNIEY